MKVTLELDHDQIDRLVCKALKDEIKASKKLMKQWPESESSEKELIVHFKAALDYFGGNLP